MHRQKGFTLIELIIAIILVSILVTYVIPRYFSLAKEARRSVIVALGGTLQVALEIVHSTAVARSVSGGGSVTMGDGRIVTVGNTLYPIATSAGIVNALTSTNGVTLSYATNTATFSCNGAENASACNAVYTYNSTSGSAIPTVVVTDSDCS